MPSVEVGPSVARIHDDLAVGTNRNFQKKWWYFERAFWLFLILFVVAGFIGLMGRGPLSRGEAASPDGLVQVQYERFARYKTPSLISVKISPEAIHNNAVRFWVSTTLVSELGTERVVPQPAISVPGKDRIDYIFPAQSSPLELEFQLQPGKPGKYQFAMGLANPGPGIPNGSELRRSIVVFP